MKPADADTLKFFEGIVGLVEANSFEYHCLWEHNENRQERIGQPKREWVQNLSGIGRVIGQVGDRPVFLSLRTAVIDGQKILFWEATSEVVDHPMIKAWFRTNLPISAFKPDSDYLNSEDANNFHSVFRYVE